MLAEVADPEQVLALSHYSSDPASSSMDVAVARRFRSVSGSVEEVVALRPDLVIAGSFLSPQAAAAFADFGIRVERLPIAATVEESKAQVARIAALAGHAGRGASLNARIDAALAAAAPPAGARPVPAVVWQSGGIVAGAGTLASDLLARTGFANFAAERGLQQAQVLPLETMLADPPRVVLAAIGSEGSEDRMLAHPALGGLPGTRRVDFPPSLVWCGGPTIPRAVARLAAVREGLRR